MLNKKLIMLIILFVTAFLTHPFLVQKSDAAVEKIAEVSQYTGEVMVRTGMEWNTLKKVPYPLFPGDKVVTKQGRAEIRFLDGSLLRLDLDSNIRISEKKEKRGLIFKKLVFVRNIKIILGKVWFDVRPGKDTETTFVAPTMTAAIRGTKGISEVATNGSSAWGLTEGSAETKGNFSKPRTFVPPNVNIPARQLPPRNPAAVNSLPQKAVAESVVKQAAAKAATEKADTATAAAAKVVDKKGAAIADAQASAAKSEAARFEAEARVASASETVVEAKTLRDTAAANLAQEAVNKAVVAAKTVTELANNAIKAAAQARAAADVNSAVLAATVAKSAADASDSAGAVVAMNAFVAAAQSAGEKDEAVKAIKAVASAEDVAKKAKEAASDVVNIAEKAAKEKNADVVKAALELGKAAAEVVKANTELALSIKDMGRLATFGDIEGADKAAVAIVKAEASTKASFEALKEGTKALEKGDVKGIQEAGITVNITAKETSNIVTESAKQTMESLATVERVVAPQVAPMPYVPPPTPQVAPEKYVPPPPPREKSHVASPAT